MNQLKRNSSIELLRIIAQLFIVYYHIFLIFVYPQLNEPFYKAIQIPLHIGVILFILISGYFGIKPSIKGFVRLVLIVSLYYLPLRYYDLCESNASLLSFVKSSGVISRTPYWFIRTYLCFYLFVPIVNFYIKNVSAYKRRCFLLILVFISIYLGTAHGDPTLWDGKNIVNFTLIYTIGHELSKMDLNRFNKWSILAIYLLLNVFSVTIYCILSDSIISKILFHVSYPYCSPLLIFNAILFFILIARIHFSSKLINWCAQSVLAIYLIHCHPFILDNLIGPVCIDVCKNITGEFMICFVLFVFAILIMIFSIVIDKLLYPVWTIVNDISEKIECLYTRICNRYIHTIE